MVKYFAGVLIVCTPLSFAQITSQSLGAGPGMSYEQVQKQDYENQKAEICGYFTQLVGNFLNIVQRPQDSAHVSGNIAHALQNIVNIAMTCIGRAMSRIKRSNAPLNCEEIEQIKSELLNDLAEYEDVIRAAFVNEFAQVDDSN